MTPQEKAIELVAKFSDLKTTKNSKECALIVTDEVLSSQIPRWDVSKEANESRDWWKDVQEEIKKI